MLKKWLALGLLLGLLVSWGAAPAAAQQAQACTLVYNVGNQTDLAAAITAIRNCTVAATYRINLTANIALTSTLPSLWNNFDARYLIDGKGFSISGEGIYAIFFIEGDATIVTLQNITLKNGYNTTGGSAIYNNGDSLTVINSTFTNNTTTGNGGAIYNRPGVRLTVRTSLFSYNFASIQGGAIYNRGIMVVDQTRFLNNTALQNGGAVSLSGATNTRSVGGVTPSGISLNPIRRSLFRFNKAGNAAPDGYGGAVYVISSNLLLINNTFTANTASYGGGVTYSGGTLVLRNNTIYANTARQAGSGIYIQGSLGQLLFHNNIIAGGNNMDCSKFGSGPMLYWSPNQSNILQTNYECAYSSQIRAVAPLLGTFGGAPTAYFSLQAGSPAINNGDNATCDLTSQNGVARPVGGTCDIGSYEKP